MKTQSFRTKTLFINRKNPAVEGVWGIAIDIGYSGTKVFAPNGIACFPSFAIPVTGGLLNMSSPGEETILYRDSETGEIWKVGKAAQDIISPKDPDQNSASIYGRQRYFSAMYRVISRTAMGIACMPNEYGGPSGKKVFVETGLPNKYLKSDKPLIQEALAGRHVFDIKVGSREWNHFDIELAENDDDIHVMAQPVGTLLSVSTGNNGAPIPKSADYLTASVAICDPGFGTMDCFAIRGGEIAFAETFTDLSMQKVLGETSEKIYRELNVEIPVPAMQKYLEKGFVTTFDRKLRGGKNVEFGNLLEECNRKIAEKTIEKLCELYDNLLDYDYLIVTGGTGEAWYSFFEEAFQNMPNLTLIPGNQNTEGILADEDGNLMPLPFIFSNARGYYMSMQRRLSKLTQ